MDTPDNVMQRSDDRPESDTVDNAGGPAGRLATPAAATAKAGASWPVVLRALERVLAAAANVAVILGVLFAIHQIRMNENTERRRIAIEVTNTLRSPEFLSAYRKLKAATADPALRTRDQTALVDAINYVMNVYDAIALQYLSGTADRCIIENAVRDGAPEIALIARALAYPPALRQNLEALLTALDGRACPFPRRPKA